MDWLLLSRRSKQILPNFGQRVETLRGDNDDVKSKPMIWQTFSKQLVNACIYLHSEAMQYEFSAELLLWSHDSSFALCYIPVDIAAEIDEVTQGLRRGFGSVRVEVQLGASKWRTSIFKEAKVRSYLLPVKKAVRLAESVTIGDRLQLKIELVDF